MGVFFDPQTGAVGWASDTDTSGLQPLDSDLTAIAALTPTNDDIIQRKAGAWTNRTMAQLAGDLTLSNIGGSVTDAQVPNTITLDNITQITTRPHSSLTGLTSGDDHTQYALLAGRSGGQTLYGGTGATDNLTLYANDEAQPNAGLIKAYGHISIDPDNITFNSTPNPAVFLAGTYTIAYGGSKGGAFRDASTLIFQATSTTFAASLFNAVTVVKNDSSMVIGLAPYVCFIGNFTIQADTQDITQFKQNTFVERGVFEGINGGILRTTLWNRYETDSGILGAIKSGAIVYEANAAKFAEPLVAGTGLMHNNRGVYLPSYTSGRDFNYAILSGAGLVKHGDDTEIDSTDGTKGLVQHDSSDTRHKYTSKLTTGALQATRATFNPPVDMDLFAYYRADQANVGGVADGADVTAWYDKSGAGRDLAQGGGTDVPIWENAVAYANNQPAVNFTAANSQSLENTRDATIQIALTGPWSWWGVLSFKTVAAAQTFFNHNTNIGRGAHITATPQWQLRMGSGAATVGGTPAVDTVYLVRLYMTSTTQEMFVNEVSVTSGANPQNMSQIVYGAHRTGAPVYSSFLNGYIYESGIYNAGNISSHAQWNNYLNYVNTRYGTTITTPTVTENTNTHSLITSSNITAVGNVGTGEDDLMTYSLPGNYLSADGDSVPFEATGTVANNANQKRIKIKFGATTILDTGATGIATGTAYDWVARGRIVRTGAATQDAYAQLWLGTTLAFSDFTSPTETLSSAVTFKFTGETNAASNNDVVQELMIVGVDGS